MEYRVERIMYLQVDSLNLNEKFDMLVRDVSFDQNYNTLCQAIQIINPSILEDIIAQVNKPETGTKRQNIGLTLAGTRISSLADRQ